MEITSVNDSVALVVKILVGFFVVAFTWAFIYRRK